MKEVSAPFPEALSTQSLLDKNQTITIIDQGAEEIGAELVRLFKENQYSVQLAEDASSSNSVIIFLSALRFFNQIAEAIAMNQQAFTVARSIAPRFSQNGGTFIIVQNTGGNFGISSSSIQAWSSGLSGLIKTAQSEWPSAHLKTIDVDLSQYASPFQIAQQLFKEMISCNPTIEVGLHPSKRITVVPQKSYIGETEQKLKDNDVIVVTGGAKGITAACIIELAKHHRLKIALLGRSIHDNEPAYLKNIPNEDLKKAIFAQCKLTGQLLTPKNIEQEARKVLAIREINETLHAIHNTGSSVRYFSVDIQNSLATKQTVSLIRQEWGPIAGLIHGAGVLADKQIKDKTDEQFSVVFNTKVLGLKTLLDETQNDPLKVICFFSSVAARYGNIGQSDYAMANEVLNKIAHVVQQQRGATCLVKSINWGPWDYGMVTPELKKLFGSKGIVLLPTHIGTQLFVDELMQQSTEEVEVILGSPIVTETAAKPSQPPELLLTVDNNSHSFLKSHVISDLPVLPMCLALEWFTQFAEKKLSLTQFSIRALALLKGIRLENFENQQHIFKITALSSETNDAWKTQLLDQHNIPRYRAAIVTQSEKASGSYEPRLIPSQWQFESFYQDQLLFHGPDFQVLQKASFSKQGAEARLIGINKLQWKYSTSFTIDVALLDGGLQLLRLWGYHELNRLSLPTKIGTFKQHQKPTIYETAFCKLEAIQMNAQQIKGNLYFFTDEGKPIAELLDVEFVMQPRDSKGHL